MKCRRGGLATKIKTGAKLATLAYGAYQVGKLGYGLYKLHGKLKADRESREFNDRKDRQFRQPKVYV